MPSFLRRERRPGAAVVLSGTSVPAPALGRSSEIIANPPDFGKGAAREEGVNPFGSGRLGETSGACWDPPSRLGCLTSAAPASRRSIFTHPVCPKTSLTSSRRYLQLPNKAAALLLSLPLGFTAPAPVEPLLLWLPDAEEGGGHPAPRVTGFPEPG